MAARPQDAEGHSGPVTSTVAITVSDTTTYDPPLRGILIGVAGDLTLVYTDGSTDTFASGELAVGVFHPIYGIRKVMDTGTDATGIHGGY